jgi:hypothetical protein
MYEIKIAALPIFAFWLIAMTSLVNAQSTGIGYGALSISNLVITPNPVTAGSNVEISFQLYNSYQYSLNNVNLYLEGSYPLLNYSPQTIGQISSIGEGLYGGINSYISYNFTIPKDIPSGVYTLDLYATYQTTQVTNTGTLSYAQPVTAYSVIPIALHVVGAPSISASASVSSAINPGEPFTLTLNLQNNGYGNARNISVSISNTSYFKPLGSSTFEIGFLPIGQSVQIPITMLARYNISNATYSVPISIKYYSTTGKIYTSNSSIQIISSILQPNISVSLVGAMPPVLYSGYNQTLEFSISNIGNGIARNITISVYPSSQINLLGSVHTFKIGEMPPGSSINEEVFVSSNMTNMPSGNLIINVSYYSSNYKKSFSKSYNETLYFMPSAQFEIVGVSGRLYPGATDVPITYTILNNGNEPATQVEVSFQGIYPITPIDGNAYVAKIMPGQEANVTFMVNVDTSGVPGNYPVTLFETWKQPNGTPNQLYTGSNNYYAEVLKGTDNNMVFWEIITVVVVVAIATVFAGRRPKKKQKA